MKRWLLGTILHRETVAKQDSRTTAIGRTRSYEFQTERDLMRFCHSKAVVGLMLTIVTAAACASTPTRAPGSNPQDMTPEGHEAAAKKEQDEAAKHREQADKVQPNKPVVERTVRQGHENQAAQHQDFSKQHAGAAAAARDAGAE